MVSSSSRGNLFDREPTTIVGEDDLNDDRHAPGYQRKRDRLWVWKARRLVS